MDCSTRVPSIRCAIPTVVMALVGVTGIIVLAYVILHQRVAPIPPPIPPPTPVTAPKPQYGFISLNSGSVDTPTLPQNQNFPLRFTPTQYGAGVVSFSAESDPAKFNSFAPNGTTPSSFMTYTPVFTDNDGSILLTGSSSATLTISASSSPTPFIFGVGFFFEADPGSFTTLAEVFGSCTDITTVTTAFATKFTTAQFNAIVPPASSVILVSYVRVDVTPPIVWTLYSLSTLFTEQF